MIPTLKSFCDSPGNSYIQLLVIYGEKKLWEKKKESQNIF